ncbi:GcrA family cell cycle regulator [Acetobacter sicerae]|uniref:GcrA family cell cycle regulator n=1 Tax=Acetobacter sicerae TaxID=85325 RepID=A0ABS8VUS4_9PROT|nr:GcrA family cell cycle regulator [Acetobacter sicerae]MCE0743954.1 GcrA family cell cycle regulator [Acetobacter sicerae]
MEWTDETIARLKALWQEGLSTAEIGRQLGITKNAVVGKAHRLGLPARPSPIRRQDGKTAAKKTAETGEQAKASAPRRTAKETASAESAPAASVSAVAAQPAAVTADAATSGEASASQVKKPAEKPVVVSSTKTESAPAKPLETVAVNEKPAEQRVKATVPALTKVAQEEAVVEKPAPVAKKASPASRPAAQRLAAVMEPRRRSATCCWPLGDPGTPGFHFCGATPLPGKPYCAEHAAMAYVKLRDRRENAG